MKNNNDMKTLMEGLDSYLKEITNPTAASVHAVSMLAKKEADDLEKLVSALVDVIKNVKVLLSAEEISSGDFDAALDVLGSIGDQSSGDDTLPKIGDAFHGLRGTLAKSRDEIAPTMTDREREAEFEDTGAELK